MAVDPRQKPAFSTPAIVILAAVMVAGAGLWLLSFRPVTDPPAPPEVNAEGKEYVSNLKLSDVQLTESESFSGHKLVALSGKIANAGDRTVKLIELTCIFQDLGENVIGRERLAIVKKALPPGEARDFRLPFEKVPPGWNQGLPQLVIARIEFE